MLDREMIAVYCENSRKTHQNAENTNCIGFHAICAGTMQ